METVKGTPVKADRVLFRYRDSQIDEIWDTRPIEAVKSMRLYLDSYPVIKETPCGVWVDLGYNRKKFINQNLTKQWAHESLDDAMKSFVARKKRQISILKNQLLRAEAALCLEKATPQRLHQGMFYFPEDPHEPY